MLNDFQTLGISSSASMAEIKKAYRLKAKEFHPDVNDSPDAADQFRKITEAYHRIIDFREGRHNYQQPAIDYEAILREKARARAYELSRIESKVRGRREKQLDTRDLLG
jgi:DnaJ-class molecular chaperone